MARLIKCPRCQAQIDVTTVAGGSTVKCPDCAVQVRVPTGETGKYPKVAEPVAAAAPAKKIGGGRQTDIFRRMAGAKAPGARGPSRSQMAAGGSGYERGANARKSNNAPLIIGGVIAAVALIVVLVVAMNSSKPKEGPKKTVNRIEDTGSTSDPEPDPQPQPGKQPGKDRPVLQRDDSGKYVAPPTFERGAERYAQRAERLKVDAADQKAAEDMLRVGNLKGIQEREDKYLAGVLNSMLSDDEAVAKAAFQYLHDFCERNKLHSEQSGKNPIQMNLFNSAQYRGGDFAWWAGEWYPKNAGKLGPGEVIDRRIDPKAANWEYYVQKLKGGAKGYDDPNRPEGAVMQTLKAMSVRSAIEGFLSGPWWDDEDLNYARGINNALEHLTGQNMGLTPANKAQVKDKWKDYAAKQSK
jgi:hypothetical protein